MPGELPAAIVLGVAALMAVVTGHCLAACVAAAPEPGCHGLSGWHAAMGAAMLAMVLTPFSGLSALVEGVVFAVGAGWLLVRARARGRVRTAAAFAVMAVMAAPMALPPASAESTGMHAGGSHDGASGGMGHAGMATPGWLAALLLGGALVVGVAALVAGVRARGRSARVSAGCEVAMAGVMALLAALAI